MKTLPYAPATISVRPIQPADAATVRRMVLARWGETVVSNGVEHRPAELPGFLAQRGTRAVGVLTCRMAPDGWQIVTIDSMRPGSGVGSALLRAAGTAAEIAGVRRLWLVTTNDNTDALRFYQRRGFVLTELRAGAIAAARQIKPSIPATGAYGIPIRDELLLELRLEPAPPALKRARRRAGRGPTGGS